MKFANHTRFLAVVALTLAAGAGFAGDDPTTHPSPLPLSTIRPGHPRLWFNSDNVELLRQRWNDPAYSSIVGKYKGKTDAVSLALEGLATYNGSKCSEAAAQVSASYVPAGDPDAGHANPISLVFDWCYNELSASEKAVLVSKISALRQQNRDNSSSGVRSRFHWHETFRFSSFAYIASVLAIEGEPGVSSELRLAQNVLQNLQELGDEVSGGGGYRTYFYQGNIQTLPFLMWSVATNFDFASHSRFTRNLAKWAVRKLSPTGHGFLRGPADDDAVESGYTRDQLSAGGFYLLASHFDDPVAQWLGNHLRTSLGQSRHWQFDGPAFISLAHYEPGRPAASPLQAGLPLSSLFEASGMAHVRSSWAQSPEVVHAWFYNGPAAGHSGESQNHFTIWRGDDPLIIQGGNYLGTPSTYQSHYNARAVSDNTLLFSPAGSNDPDHDGGQTRRWSNYNLSKIVYPVAERVGSWSGQHLYSGEIIHFEDTASSTIVSGDATLAYDPDLINAYVRDFVYLKPDVFLIRDRFDTTNVEAVRSLVHSRHKPLYHSTPIVRLGNPEAGVLELNDSSFRIQHGSSQASVDVLWPPEPSLRFVGGEGYEGYADGYNSDPDTDCQDWLKSHRELAERKKLIEGQWRTEIESTPTESDGSLIMAVFVSGPDPASLPQYSIRREGTDVIVSVSVDGQDFDVLFPKFGSPTVGASTSVTIFSDRFDSGSLDLWSSVSN